MTHDYPGPAASPVGSASGHSLSLVVLVLTILVILVLLKMTERVLAARRYAKQQEPLAIADANRCQSAVPPPAFASAAHADAVFLYANRSLYQFLLAELRRVLKDEGYIMVTDRHQHANIDTASWERIARHLFLARQQFLVMKGVYQCASLAEKNHREEARELFLCLAKGCSDTGWYIARPEADAYGKPDEASQ